MHRIQNSVGRGGRNTREDVVIVQTLLNRHILPPARLLVIDGMVGSKTIGAILILQHRLGIETCDGRVDPAGKTIQALLSEPKSVHVTQFPPFSFDHAFRALATVSHEVLFRFKSSEPIKISIPNKASKNAPTPILRSLGGNAIAWGAKVRPEFKKRVIEICRELEISPDYLMACMALETGETFRADVPNMAGSGAVGLIQFMPATAELLGTSTADLAKMSSVQQLDYVRKYFIGYRGKLKCLEDVYMVIFWPRAIGKSSDTVLFKKGSKVYLQNSGFDRSPKDGVVTKGECSSAVRHMYDKGIGKGFFG